MAKIIFKRGDETFDINMPEGVEFMPQLKLQRFQQIAEDNVMWNLSRAC